MMKYYNKKLAGKLLGYLFRGILLSVPLAVTIYAFLIAFNTIDHIVPTAFFGVTIPGIGILVLLIFFIVMGWLGNSIIAQPIISYFNKSIEQVPLIKTIYSSVKDLLSAFVGQKKSFNQPVLIKLHQQYEIEQLGFVTSTDLSTLSISEEKVAVYIPLSYSLSGNLYIVPKANVRPLDVSAPDVMKFIVSGGVTTFDNTTNEPTP